MRSDFANHFWLTQNSNMDAHTHLYAAEYDADLEQVLQAAHQVGIGRMLVVNENEHTMTQVINLCAKFPNVLYPLLGVHPCDVTSEAQVAHVISCITDQYANQIVGIGEVGLDFLPHNLAEQAGKCNMTVEQVKALQRATLCQFATLAQKHNWTLNVHSRSAGKPTLDLLSSQFPNVPCMMHAFDGSVQHVKRALQTNQFYFSIPANIVRSDSFCKMVQVLPLDRMLLETDSPALAPVIQTRNEPKNAILSVQKIAQLKNVTEAQVLHSTTETAKKLFPKAFT